MKLRALDLYCGAGGATRGLQLAGFHVTGVDIKAQPRYVGDQFYQGDALEFPVEGFDFIWASPPCQKFTTGTLSQRMAGTEYPDLVDATREHIIAAGVPYVMENVMGAPLKNAVMLCGSVFGLRTWRHRLFELSPHFTYFPMLPPCNHYGLQVVVCGDNTPSWSRAKNGGKNFTMKERNDAMGIDWMDRRSLSLSVPPAYSYFIGQQAIQLITESLSGSQPPASVLQES